MVLVSRNQQIDRNIAGAVLAASPPFTTMAYIAIRQAIIGVSSSADLITLPILLLIGCTAFVLWPGARWKRLVSAVLYFLGMACVTVYCAMIFVCAAYSGCL